MNPKWVTAHLMSGNYPALVTRENPDGTLNLTVFSDADIVYRTSASRYVPEPDDDDNDKIGMWSE